MNGAAAGSFLETAAHTAASLYERYQNLHERYQPSQEEA
jgi:pyruvate-ferredoxin/flavodoxin oxidoreductase